MIRCKIILIILLASLKISYGQKAPEYDAINACVEDFLADWFDSTFSSSYNRFCLLETSIKLPPRLHDDVSDDRRLIILEDVLSEYIPRENVKRMLTDSSDYGTRWQKKFFKRKAILISDSEAKKKEQYGCGKTYTRKVNRAYMVMRDKLSWEEYYRLTQIYFHRYKCRHYQFSYPVFASKKEYALIYMTNGDYRGCYYLCHVVNGKFDKIAYKVCWQVPAI